MKGCLIATLIIVVAVALAALGFYGIYTSVTEDFPEYATREVVYARHGDLIKQVQSSIDASESKYDLAARLEKIRSPEELLYLTLTTETAGSFDDEKMEIIEKLDVSSSSYTIVNGTGYGKLNDIAVIVINLPVGRHSVEDLHIFIKYEPAGG